MSKKRGSKGGVNVPALPRTFGDESTWVQRKAFRDGRDKEIRPNKQRLV